MPVDVCPWPAPHPPHEPCLLTATQTVTRPGPFGAQDLPVPDGPGISEALLCPGHARIAATRYGWDWPAPMRCAHCGTGIWPMTGQRPRWTGSYPDRRRTERARHVACPDSPTGEHQPPAAAAPLGHPDHPATARHRAAGQDLARALDDFARGLERGLAAQAATLREAAAAMTAGLAPDPLDLDPPPDSDPERVIATVRESGGGTITMVVHRSTQNYPQPGDQYALVPTSLHATDPADLCHRLARLGVATHVGPGTLPAGPPSRAPSPRYRPCRHCGARLADCQASSDRTAEPCCTACLAESVHAPAEWDDRDREAAAHPMPPGPDRLPASCAWCGTGRNHCVSGPGVRCCWSCRTAGIGIAHPMVDGPLAADGLGPDDPRVTVDVPGRPGPTPAPISGEDLAADLRAHGIDAETLPPGAPWPGPSPEAEPEPSCPRCASTDPTDRRVVTIDTPWHTADARTPCPDLWHTRAAPIEPAPEAEPAPDRCPACLSRNRSVRAMSDGLACDHGWHGSWHDDTTVDPPDAAWRAAAVAWVTKDDDAMVQAIAHGLGPEVRSVAEAIGDPAQLPYAPNEHRAMMLRTAIDSARATAHYTGQPVGQWTGPLPPLAPGPPTTRPTRCPCCHSADPSTPALGDPRCVHPWHDPTWQPDD